MSDEDALEHGDELECNLPDEQLEALATTIINWPLATLADLLPMVKNVWAYADWGWHEKKTREGTEYYISTAGWSDNERLIAALEKNYIFWSMCWVESRRGGHYKFVVKKGLFDGVR